MYTNTVGGTSSNNVQCTIPIDITFDAQETYSMFILTYSADTAANIYWQSYNGVQVIKDSGNVIILSGASQGSTVSIKGYFAHSSSSASGIRREGSYTLTGFY